MKAKPFSLSNIFSSSHLTWLEYNQVKYWIIWNMGIHLVFVLYELSKEIYKQVRGVYRTKLNVYDGFFFQKKLTINVND